MNITKRKNKIYNLFSAFIVSVSFVGCLFSDDIVDQVSAVNTSEIHFKTGVSETFRTDFTTFCSNVESTFQGGEYDKIVCYSYNSQFYYIPFELCSTSGTLITNFHNDNTATVLKKVSNPASALSTTFEQATVVSNKANPAGDVINTSNYTACYGYGQYAYNRNVFTLYNNSEYVTNFDNSSHAFTKNWDLDAYWLCDFVFEYDPILSPILDYPYNLDVQKQSFTEWLITTEKYKEIKSNMLSAHVNGFVEIFANYGGSLSFFKKWASQYFSFINIGQGVTDYNVILNKTRSLYQEFLRAKSDTVGNHLAPRVSSTIEPDTNDSNQTLITNTIDDTEIVSILRDILRTLLSFPATWYDMHQQLMMKLDELDLTTNIVNDGGTNDLDMLFTYDQDEFESDWNSFEDAINDDVASKTALIDSINNRSVMPENMLSDQTTFSLTVPLIDGYTVSQDGTSYSTHINNYTFDMSDHPTFDSVFKKIKRFIGVIMIIAYLVSLRYRIPRIVRGES